MATISSLLDPLRNAVNTVAGSVKGIAENVDLLVSHLDAVHGDTYGARILQVDGETRRLTERDRTNDKLQKGLGTRDIGFRDGNGIPAVMTTLPVLVVVAKRFPRITKRTKPEDVAEAMKIAEGVVKRNKPHAILPLGFKTLDDLQKRKVPVWVPPAMPVFKGHPDLEAVAPEFTGTFVDGLPKECTAPKFVIVLPEDQAVPAGLNHTAVVMWPWPDVMRAHTILTLHKIIKEGIVDQLLALNYFTADVQKMVEKLGPALGTTARGQLLYRLMAMALTGVYRANGVPVFPEAVRMFDPFDEFFLFKDSIYGETRGESVRNNVVFKVNPEDDSDVRFFGLDITTPDEDPWPYDPLGNPEEGVPWRLVNQETGRELKLDPRMDPMFLAQYYIYVMGWEEPGNQQHFNQVARFKLHFGNAFRRIATEQVIARVRVTYQTPGVTSEAFVKDIKAAMDPTGKEQGGVFPTGIFTSKVDLKSLVGSVHFDKDFWEDLYRFLLDAASEMWEAECGRDAANNLLTIAAVDKAASAGGWQWNHLTPAEKAARMLRIYRLAYEVVEREKVWPALERETFGRKAAESLIDKGLYEHLPHPEKEIAEGKLLACGDAGDIGSYLDVTVPNDARMDKSYQLVKAGFGCYPEKWLPRRVQDEVRNVVMFEGYLTIAVIDNFLGPFAKSHGVVFNRDGQMTQDQQIIHGALTGKGVGIKAQRLLSKWLRLEFAVSEDGVSKKAIVERNWRIYLLAIYRYLDLIFLRYGVKMGLEQRFVRVMTADDAALAEEVLESAAEIATAQEKKGRVEDEDDPVLALTLLEEKFRRL